MKRFLFVPSMAAYMLVGFNISDAFASKSIVPPEPATMLLFGCGLIAFVVIRRRKKGK